eukprot:scaffold127425_cov31-Tisochrysis_lutea.AAC.1
MAVGEEIRVARNCSSLTLGLVVSEWEKVVSKRIASCVTNVDRSRVRPHLVEERVGAKWAISAARDALRSVSVVGSSRLQTRSMRHDSILGRLWQCCDASRSVWTVLEFTVDLRLAGSCARLSVVGHCAVGDPERSLLSTKHKRTTPSCSCATRISKSTDPSKKLHRRRGQRGRMSKSEAEALGDVVLVAAIGTMEATHRRPRIREVGAWKNAGMAQG